MADRVWDNAIEMGLRNKTLIQLAKHHCTRMEFLQSGGSGIAEETTGLPINMRQVRCPVAHGSMAMNLELIVPDFYRKHCIGCDMRSPTGQVPNLATLVEEQDAAAADAQSMEIERTAVLHKEWSARVEARRAVVSQIEEVMASAVADIGLLDMEPGAERDRTVANEAIARLRALAERVPQLFTQHVVSHTVELVAAGFVTANLLDPLRLLARSRPEFSREVVTAALAILRRSPSVAAGRCVADLIQHVSAPDVDDEVCRSLVALAGAPQGDGFYRKRQLNDPVGLIAVADLVPVRLVRLLRLMLPGPPPARRLVLPPGAAPREVMTRSFVGSAAGAVRVLAWTHPQLAAELVNPLVMQLSSLEFDSNHGELSAVQRALAELLVGGVGDVPEAMSAAAASRSDELGKRLVGVLAIAEDLVSANSRAREPRIPMPKEKPAADVVDLLFALAMGRLGGDWGAGALHDASVLIEDLAKSQPDLLLARLPALLGGLLQLISTADQTPVSSLDVVSTESPTMRALQAAADNLTRGSAIGRLLTAVTTVAVADPTAVVAALTDLLEDERGTDRGADVAYYVLKTLGDIGHSYGDGPGLLQAVLPVLHTYLVSADVGSRARALDAWVRIGRRHQLPSTLVDLLPALASDPYILVARALLRASYGLTWPAEAVPKLMLHAVTLSKVLKDRSDGTALKEAIYAILALRSGIEDEGVRQSAEANALAAADILGPHDLKAVLRSTWSSGSARSAQMTRLRFKQATDPRINDRFNQRHDDPELVSLLSCGPGLLSLSTQDLIEAAVELGPDQPVPAVEFVEVAWRAARPGDAVNVIEALIAATPDQPAYKKQRLFFNAIAAAARADAAAIAGKDWSRHSDEASTAVTALTRLGGTEHVQPVLDSLVASMGLRRLLMDTSPVDAGDPAGALRRRADEFVRAGGILAKSSVKATTTGAYLRAVAAFSEVVAHLLRAEAAAFEADPGQMAAQWAAADRRCNLISSEVAEALGTCDPIGGPLLDLLRQARAHSAGEPTTPLLGRWATLPIPVPVVVGRRRTRVPGTAMKPSASSKRSESPPVAVVLASLDGRLITGPAVLRHRRVYQLTVRVQTAEWPAWASQLDGEFLSHLTEAEITTPTFSWLRSDHVGDGETYERDGSLVLRFSVAAGATAPPLLVRLNWRGKHDDGTPRYQPLDVAGHRELRLRPYDETRDRATEYPVFDERLLAMYDRLARAGFDEDQLQAFCRLFTSICRVGLAITWEKKYRRGTKVTEKVFHDDIHNRLLADPELGGRVERGTALALGFLDVRHDGITAELKVERQTPVTEVRAPKYMGQPTQYAAANGARLSILAILDMSPKEMPIGTPENYLFELVPKLHGLVNPEAPSLVAVLVVNGNLPTPSSWSRKKTPVQENNQLG